MNEEAEIYGRADHCGAEGARGGHAGLGALLAKRGVSDARIYKWRANYGGMEVSEAKRLKALEEENAKLKKLLAEQMLDVAALRELYAEGVSPRDIAIQLNMKGNPGPHGFAWRDTAIRGHGHVDRGAGILNNELYIGRAIWNRREYRKNLDTERRIARHNGTDTWVVDERPELRIVSDKLWAKAKRRQGEVREFFVRRQTRSIARIDPAIS